MNDNDLNAMLRSILEERMRARNSDDSEDYPEILLYHRFQDRKFLQGNFHIENHILMQE